MKAMRFWAVLLPVFFITALVVLYATVLVGPLGIAWGDAVVWGLGVVGIVLFTGWIFHRLEAFQRALDEALALERREAAQLEALSEATLLLNRQLSLKVVLEDVVGLARQVLGADYGTLGVTGEHGSVERLLTSGEEGVGAGPSLECPVTAGDEVIGSLFLARDLAGTAFEESDRRILERFAAQAAVAIVNARLYEDAHRVSAVEERERIAMDLHDGVVQSIYGTALALRAIEGHLTSGAAREVEAIVGRLDAVTQEVRDYVYDLRQLHLREDDFVRVIEGLVRSSRTEGGPEIRFTHQGDFADVPRGHQAELWHVTHEALANALRHGSPTKVEVTLGRDAQGGLTMTIRDDGTGFAPDAAMGPGHQGLGNMRQRAAQIGGRVLIVSSPGLGARVTVDVPAADLEEA